MNINSALIRGFSSEDYYFLLNYFFKHKLSDCYFFMLKIPELNLYELPKKKYRKYNFKKEFNIFNNIDEIFDKNIIIRNVLNCRVKEGKYEGNVSIYKSNSFLYFSLINNFMQYSYNIFCGRLEKINSIVEDLFSSKASYIYENIENLLENFEFIVIYNFPDWDDDHSFAILSKDMNLLNEIQKWTLAKGGQCVLKDIRKAMFDVYGHIYHLKNEKDLLAYFREIGY